MKQQRDPLLFVEDMVDYAEKALAFSEGFDEASFLSDERTIFAVIRCFEVIGEAANNIPIELQQRFLEIPWPKVISFRNFLIHEYLGVKFDKVWRSLTTDLPNALPGFTTMYETLLAEEKQNHGD
jgi:uncharacterized protein with HEPN domain